jgi:hypothetical protein
MADLSMMDAVKAAAGEAPPVAAVNPFAGVIVGKVFAPPRLMPYGMDGSGKSTFAAQAPNPIFVQVEEGLDQIGAARFPVQKTYEGVINCLNLVAKEKHDYKTIVIDSVSWLEKIIFDKICAASKKNTIAEAAGGFGKGEATGLPMWKEILSILDICRAKGMAVILLAHQGKEDAGDPENPMLKQIGPRLHAKTTSPLLREWVDATLWLTRRMVVNSVGSGLKETQIAQPVGADGGERIIQTAATPMRIAKNRYNLPFEIPFPKVGAWDLLMSHVSAFYNQ